MDRARRILLTGIHHEEGEVLTQRGAFGLDSIAPDHADGDLYRQGRDAVLGELRGADVDPLHVVLRVGYPGRRAIEGVTLPGRLARL